MIFRPARGAWGFVTANVMWSAAFAALFHALPGHVPWGSLFCRTLAASAALAAVQYLIEAAVRRRRPSPKR